MVKFNIVMTVVPSKLICEVCAIPIRFSVEWGGLKNYFYISTVRIITRLNKKLYRNIDNNLCLLGQGEPTELAMKKYLKLPCSAAHKRWTEGLFDDFKLEFPKCISIRCKSISLFCGNHQRSERCSQGVYLSIVFFFLILLEGLKTLV